jgi:hypothetical protein
MKASAQIRALSANWSDEPEDLRGGLIEPLRVVDQAHQRSLRVGLGQQSEQGESEDEPVWRRAGADPGRDPHRVLLRLGQAVQPIQHRRRQLMQPGERQFHLGLDRDDARHPAPGRLRAQVLKQRRLAGARAAPHNQGAALSGANSLEQRVERPAA